MRRSIILRALTGKDANSPAHAHRRCRAAIFRTFNTHNKCTGVCHFVCGIPVGIGYRVAGLWGFCGAHRSPDLPAFPIHGARVPRLPEVTQRHRSDLLDGVDSAPEDRITDRYHFLELGPFEAFRAAS